MEAASNSEIQYSQLTRDASQASSSGDLIAIAVRAYAWKGKITGEHS
jgi:hypothetical protein